MTPGSRASLAQLRGRGVLVLSGDLLVLRAVDGCSTWREVRLGLWEALEATTAPRGLRLVSG